MQRKTIGLQIAQFRKSIGMTQEELGKAVGVSTQAVSRWENGGMPDAELLPQIADILGVSIDALFSQEEQSIPDVGDVLYRWLRTQPPGTRLERLTSILWETAVRSIAIVNTSAEYSQNRPLTNPITDENGKLLRTLLSTDEGVVLGVGAEEMSFISIFPEPAEGYARYLLPHDIYRSLFAALAEPGALELLFMLHREKPTYYLASIAAKRMNITLDEASRLLELLASVGLLEKIELTLEEGTASAYIAGQDYGLIPLLYFARWMLRDQNVYLINWPMRSKPMLPDQGCQDEK